MLSAAENLAIHLALVVAMPLERAAAIAGVNERSVADAFLKLTPSIRGRSIEYSHYLAAVPQAGCDAFRLDKEVQLAQLQHMHDECLRAWTISVEHANQLASPTTKEPSGDDSLPKKAPVGDIRFLALARNLRREMQQIEKAITEHAQELKEMAGFAEVSSAASNPALATPTVETSRPTHVLDRPTAAPSVEPSASAPAPSLIATLPAASAARVLGQEKQIKSDSLPPSHGFSPNRQPDQPAKRPREIPTIENPPPRRVNKYAHVNR